MRIRIRAVEAAKEQRFNHEESLRLRYTVSTSKKVDNLSLYLKKMKRNHKWARPICRAWFKLSK